MSLSFNDYQKQAISLAVYQDRGHNVIYPALGLCGEAGEAVDKIKKWWRNHGITDGTKYTDEQRVQLAKELGDVLWYVSALAFEIQVDLEDLAQFNLEKLFGRQERGTIKGEGDNR